MIWILCGVSRLRILPANITFRISVPSIHAKQVEKMMITKTLGECGGNRTHAAARLGISVRTLQRKLRQYEMDTGRDTGAPLHDSVT